MPRHHAPLTLVLVATLVTAGCFSIMEDAHDAFERGLHGEVPLLLHANDTRKAPHSVSFDGGYERLHLEGGNHTLPVPGSATLPLQAQAHVSGHVARQPNASGASSPGSPPPESFSKVAPQMWIGEPRGRFVAEDGSVTNLTGNLTVGIITNGSTTLEGITHVRVDAVTFERGEARVRGDPVPLQRVNTTTGEEAGPNRTLVGSELTTSDDGLTVTDVRIPQGPFDEPSPSSGTLHLDPGTYVWGGGPLVIPAPSTHEVPRDLHGLTLSAPNGTLTFHDGGVPADGVRLDLQPGTASGTVHAGDDRARFTVKANQWWEHEQPRFEPRLQATVPGQGANATATIAPGGNATLWLRVEEVGRVGTAPEVNPSLAPPPALNATTGTLWYDEPNRTAFHKILEGFRMLFGVLVDLDEVTLDPGQARYLPLVVHAPHGTAPGSYDVPVTFQGDRTNAATVHVRVTVQG